MNETLETTFLKALEQNRQKLWRICSVYSKDDQDAKDLLQEVLINIWKSMSSFKGNSEIGTWMFKITLNVCLRLRTKEIKRKKKMLRMNSQAIHIHKTEIATEDDQERYGQLLQLRKCIKQLNEADRAIIALYLEELPYKEISNITGLSENNIAVKIKRIKTKLLNCINQMP